MPLNVNGALRLIYHVGIRKYFSITKDTISNARYNADDEKIYFSNDEEKLTKLLNCVKTISKRRSNIKYYFFEKYDGSN